MALDGNHAAGQSGHVADHNLIDTTLAAHTADTLIHSSGQEIAYAENATGTTMTVTTSYLDVAGCSIVVPAHTRPVYIEGEFHVDVSASPAAATTATMSAVITDDLDVVAAYSYTSFEPGNAAGFFTCRTRVRLAPDVNQRTYRLRAIKGGNTTFAAFVMNGTTASVWKSWIAAFYA